MAEPSLAVIIPTFRRPRHAVRVVAQVVAQRRPGDEILVVDQSPDEEHDWLQGHLPPGASLLRRPPGLPAARNAGLAQTAAPLVLFLDDDVILGDGCLDGHRRAFVDPTIGGAVGRIRERVLRPNAPAATNRVAGGGRIRVNLDGELPGEVEILKGANMSLRRAALAEVGWFDEGYAGTALLEDADVATRLRARGWRLLFVPEAAVEHLSAPAGGVRPRGPAVGEWWRFHNTGYYLRRHRGPGAWIRAGATFAAIAARKAASARDPRLAARLLGALAAGWISGGAAPLPLPPQPAPPHLRR